MATPHSKPELYAVMFKGKPIAAIAAKTRGEVSSYLAEGGILTIQRVSSVQAHRLGALPLEFAKDEYAHEALAEDAQPELFADGDAPTPPTAHHQV